MKYLKKVFLICLVLVISIIWTAGCSRNSIHNSSAKSTQIPSKEPKGKSTNDNKSNAEDGAGNGTAKADSKAKIPDEFLGKMLYKKEPVTIIVILIKIVIM